MWHRVLVSYIPMACRAAQRRAAPIVRLSRLLSPDASLVYNQEHSADSSATTEGCAMPPPTYTDIAIDLDPQDDDSFLVKVRAPDGAEARAVFTPPAGAAFADLLAQFADDSLDVAGAATLGIISTAWSIRAATARSLRPSGPRSRPNIRPSILGWAKVL